MASSLGDLVVNLGANTQKFDRNLNQAKSSARSWASDVTAIFSGISLAGAASSIAGMTKGLAMSTIQLAADAETAAVQFGVLTGSAAKAADVMEQINKFAAETPFESMEITAAARQLMAFGFSSESVVGELRTLGDLSAGMQIPLTELADLYGKARVQGRLYMEDINQLQGRGINITAELAKEFGNVREAVEKGQVNFSHLQKALQSMTSEGGDFFQMMLKMAGTFSGQLSTLIDNVKTLGRDIGEMILPPLKDIVNEANNILGKFNEMPDKIDFIGDVLETSFEVAMLSIRDNWDKMLQGMLADGIEFGRKHLNNMAKVVTLPADVLGSPLETARKLADPIGTAREAAGLGPGRQRETDLNAAVARLDALMARVQGPAVGAGAAGNAGPAAEVKPTYQGDSPAIKALNEAEVEWKRLGVEHDKALKAFAEAPQSDVDALIDLQKKWENAKAALLKMADETMPALHKAAAKEGGGRRMKEGVSSLWDSLQSPLAEAQMAAQGMWDRGKIKAGAAMGTLENIFTGDKKEKPVEPRLAGAMAAGSQEAYSTIVQAMIRQTDPNVKATEKQTRELKKALRENRPQPVHLVAAFEM